MVGLTLLAGPGQRAQADDPVRPAAGDCVQDGAVETGAIFNDPHTSDRDRIHRHIGCLIDGAPVGAKVNIASYHFADDTITTAVTDAIGRGVHVKIVVDAKVPDNEDDSVHLQRVQDQIDDTGDDKSAITPCPKSDPEDDKGCLSNRRMHNKLITISETHGTPHVTFLTSSNFEDNDGSDGLDNSGLAMWNSGYTAADDEPLYSWFADSYFQDLLSGETDLSYYDDETPKEAIGNYRVFHSPRADGTTALDDALNKVQCHGNSSGGTRDDHRTIIRVSMWSISDTDGIGTAIAKKLWELDNAGCYVDVVADGIGTKKTGYVALKTLLKKPVPTDGVNYHGPEVREFYGDLPYGLHEKNLMIDGHFGGAADQKVVFTGSYNFTKSSAGNSIPGSNEVRVNDETWLQVNDAGVHDRFVENFSKVRNAAHLCWQTSKVEACDGGRSDGGLDGELNCHETADKYADQNKVYLYRGTYCDGGNDGNATKSDSDYGDGAGEVKDVDNAVDSIVNTTGKHIKFYNYPDYNSGHPEGDTFCLRPGAWVNRISRYGDNSGSWSNSTSSHQVVEDPEKECDRWFGGYHEPNR